MPFLETVSPVFGRLSQQLLRLTPKNNYTQLLNEQTTDFSLISLTVPYSFLLARVIPIKFQVQVFSCYL